MKNRMLGVLLATAVVACLHPSFCRAAWGQAAPSTSTDPISVTGSGVRGAVPGDPYSEFTFSFDARSAPAANGVEGTFSGSFQRDPLFRTAPGNFATFSGVVTCLQVNGDTATIGGVITAGKGYDGDPNSPDFFSQDKRDLTGDWFITTAQDPKGDTPPDTVGFVDWGDRAYFIAIGFSSFSSLCNNPVADLGTDQFPLVSGDIKIRATGISPLDPASPSGSDSRSTLGRHLPGRR